MGWLSSIGGFVNDLLGGSDSQKNAAKNQIALAQYNNAVNEDFYLKYQTPQAYMRQLQEAGLNPNLAYGQSASSITSSIPSASSGPGGQGAALAGVAKSIFEYLGTKQAKETAETRVANATVDNINARTEAQNLANISQKAKADFMKKTGIDPNTVTGNFLYGVTNTGTALGNYSSDKLADKSATDNILEDLWKVHDVNAKAKKEGRKVDLWELF